MKEQNHVDNTITTIEMCAGYGGIGLGIKRIFGERLRTIAYCELEGFAQANLISKMEAGLLDAAPLWSDLKTFPYAEFHGLVDILIAGYPCQPFSAAGKRAGKDDPRHLWPWIADGIRLLRPRMCFFENVEGHISLGLSTVISDLEELGYKVSWGIFSASVDAGAPHQRKRVFIMAYRKCQGLEGFYNRHASTEQAKYVGADSWASGECGAWQELGNASSARHAGAAWNGSQRSQGESLGHATKSNGGVWPSRPGEPQHAWEPPRVVGNTQKLFSNGSNNNFRVSERSQEISESGDSSWQAMVNTVLSGSSPERSSSRKQDRLGEPSDRAMGHPTEPRCEGSRGPNDSVWPPERSPEPNGSCTHGAMESKQRQTQPPLGRDADGPAGGLGYAELQVSCDNRTDELRLLGNGVVPATAERAFRTLMEELQK